MNEQVHRKVVEALSVLSEGDAVFMLEVIKLEYLGYDRLISKHQEVTFAKDVCRCTHHDYEHDPGEFGSPFCRVKGCGCPYFWEGS
jgi:hypothetical protein